MKKKLLSATAMTLCAISAATGVVIPTTAAAQDVTLRSTDGSVNMRGVLVSANPEFYILRTANGELRVSASRVECLGQACPTDTVAETVSEEAAPAIVADQIAVTGSETIGLGLMPLLLEGYAAYVDAEAQAENARDGRSSKTALIADGGFGDAMGEYHITWRGSATAFDALEDKTAHIGMSSRRILPAEARELRAAGAGNMISPDQEHIVAVDSLVVVTHPDNPVGTLTLDQLGEIYSGVIKNWSEVGGNDADILVIDRPEKSGTRDVLADVFQAATVETLSPLEVRIANNSNKAAELVRENENAIGFLGYAFQRGTKPVTLINECNLPMVPDAFSARTEEYPLQRRLYLYNRADAASGQLRDFVSFAASPMADAVIAKSGFIGLGIERREQRIDGERAQMLMDPNADSYEAPFMQEMLDMMVDYDRLSTTFRFPSASSKLDERGVVDMQRLIDYLEAQPTGTEVLFAGFTDDVGPFDNNRRLSEIRAQDAVNALMEAAGNRIGNVTVNAAGFGEIAPSGCNLSEDGRQINRRVEVWIKAT